MIYFDNCATGGKKPASVLRAVRAQLRSPANPGRAGHRRAVQALALAEETRTLAGSLVGAPPERILFSKNCTESLNLAIRGLIPENTHVVTTVYDHNATLRPLAFLEREGKIRLSFARPEHGRMTLSSIRKQLAKDTSAVVLNCASNVLGARADVEDISAYCKARGLLLILDGAQFVGHGETGLPSLYYSAIAAAPHKTLYAPQGIAFLAARELPAPLLFGGTGTSGESLVQPGEAPEGFEAGTLNMPGIAGLRAGLIHCRRHEREDAETVFSLTEELHRELLGIRGVSVFSRPNRAGIVSFLVEGQDSTETADILSRAGIAVRPGIHCAPLVHRELGTLASGLVRISFGAQNTAGELRRFLTVFRRDCLR